MSVYEMLPGALVLDVETVLFLFCCSLGPLFCGSSIGRVAFDLANCPADDLDHAPSDDWCFFAEI
jgi:hypothetical protein